MSSTASTFEYRVRAQDGSVHTGRIKAQDSHAVAARLREQGLTPISVDEVTLTGLGRELNFGGQKVKDKDVALFARQLATMIGAGVSIMQALRALAAQAQNPAFATVVKDLSAWVESGASLSAAMDNHTKLFPPVMRAMVRAGEAGGFMDEALAATATSLEADAKLRRTIKGAMTYPIVVLCIAVIAVIAMLLFIVPVFANIFAGLDAKLPAPTLFMVAAGNVLKVAGLPLIAVVVAGVVWWRRHRHDDGIRSRVEPLMLKVPLFGPLMTKAAVARFVRNLSTMSASGVPVVQALHLVGATSGNWAVEQAVVRIGEHVRGGGSLAEAIEAEELFPPLVAQMVKVGEDSGELDQMLARVAGFYDEEVQATAESLTSLLEPVMIVVVGGIVGSMLLALYLPILTIADQIDTSAQ